MPTKTLSQDHINHIQKHIAIVKTFIALQSLSPSTHQELEAEQSIRWLETYFKLE